MPLVKIFAKHALQKPIPLVSLQSKLCQIWGTKPDTTKLILQRVDDWTDESFGEDVYGTKNFWKNMNTHSKRWKVTSFNFLEYYY
jgi:hypothetical protein